MCGIVGFIAPKASQAWKARILRDLLLHSSIRGSEATGIAFVDPDKGLTVIKDGKAPTAFTESDMFKEALPKLPAIVMGHTRSATGTQLAGPHDNNNNHPFFDPKTGIAVIHNGSVKDSAWRKTVGKPGGIAEEYNFTGETDSEVFLRVLETCLKTCKTMEEAITDTCFNVDGSYALAFLRESEPNKIWFVKHDNPIVLALAPKEPLIIWGSTDDIITKAATMYKSHYGFFMEPVTPRLILDELDANTIVTVELTGSENDPFHLKWKHFAPNGTKLKPKNKTS